MNKFLALALLALIAMTAVVVSGEDTGVDATSVTDDADSEDEDSWNRELTVEQSSAKEYHLRSRRKSGTTKEELEFWIKVDGDSGPEFRVELENKTKETETKQKAVVRLYQLVQYAGTAEYSGTGGTTLNLRTVNWNPLQCSCDSGYTKCDCTLSANAAGGFGAITFTTSFVNTPQTIDGDTVVPTTFKWGMTYDKDSDSVALIARVATKTEQETEKESNVEDESTENQRSISKKKEKQVNFGTNGFFSWDTSFSVGAVTGTVANSLLTREDTGKQSDEAQKRVVFSFPTDAVGNLVWDPKMGFGDSSSGLSAGAIAGIVIGCVVGVALIAVIIGVIVYRSRKH